MRPPINDSQFLHKIKHDIDIEYRRQIGGQNGGQGRSLKGAQGCGITGRRGGESGSGGQRQLGVQGGVKRYTLPRQDLFGGQTETGGQKDRRYRESGQDRDQGGGTLRIRGGQGGARNGESGQARQGQNGGQGGGTSGGRGGQGSKGVQGRNGESGQAGQGKNGGQGGGTSGGKGGQGGKGVQGGGRNGESSQAGQGKNGNQGGGTSGGRGGEGSKGGQGGGRNGAAGQAGQGQNGGQGGGRNGESGQNGGQGGGTSGGKGGQGVERNGANGQTRPGQNGGQGRDTSRGTGGTGGRGGGRNGESGQAGQGKNGGQGSGTSGGRGAQGGQGGGTTGKNGQAGQGKQGGQGGQGGSKNQGKQNKLGDQNGQGDPIRGQQDGTSIKRPRTPPQGSQRSAIGSRGAPKINVPYLNTVTPAQGSQRGQIRSRGGTERNALYLRATTPAQGYPRDQISSRGCAVSILRASTPYQGNQKAKIGSRGAPDKADAFSIRATTPVQATQTGQIRSRGIFDRGAISNLRASTATQGIQRGQIRSRRFTERRTPPYLRTNTPTEESTRLQIRNREVGVLPLRASTASQRPQIKGNVIPERGGFSNLKPPTSTQGSQRSQITTRAGGVPTSRAVTSAQTYQRGQFPSKRGDTLNLRSTTPAQNTERNKLISLNQPEIGTTSSLNFYKPKKCIRGYIGGINSLQYEKYNKSQKVNQTNHTKCNGGQGETISGSKDKGPTKIRVQKDSKGLYETFRTQSDGQGDKIDNESQSITEKILNLKEQTHILSSRSLINGSVERLYFRPQNFKNKTKKYKEKSQSKLMGIDTVREKNVAPRIRRQIRRALVTSGFMKDKSNDTSSDSSEEINIYKRDLNFLNYKPNNTYRIQTVDNYDNKNNTNNFTIKSNVNRIHSSNKYQKHEIDVEKLYNKLKRCADQSIKNEVKYILQRNRRQMLKSFLDNAKNVIQITTNTIIEPEPIQKSKTKLNKTTQVNKTKSKKTKRKQKIRKSIKKIKNNSTSVSDNTIIIQEYKKNTPKFINLPKINYKENETYRNQLKLLTLKNKTNTILPEPILSTINSFKSVTKLVRNYERDNLKILPKDKTNLQSNITFLNNSKLPNYRKELSVKHTDTPTSSDEYIYRNYFMNQPRIQTVFPEYRPKAHKLGGTFDIIPDESLEYTKGGRGREEKSINNNDSLFSKRNRIVLRNIAS